MCGGSGCCCCVQSGSHTITAFAAMNIAIFTACLLVCSKEYEIISPGMRDLEDWRKVAYDMEGTNLHYFRIKSHVNSLIAAISISVLGILIGILLMCAAKMKCKWLCVAWILCESVLATTVLVLGIYITYLRHSRGFFTEASYILASIPYSAMCLICSVPFLFWSIVAICMSLKDIAGEPRQAQISVECVENPRKTSRLARLTTKRARKNVDI